jgi:hypothetical protein
MWYKFALKKTQVTTGYKFALQKEILKYEIGYLLRSTNFYHEGFGIVVQIIRIATEVIAGLTIWTKSTNHLHRSHDIHLSALH